MRKDCCFLLNVEVEPLANYWTSGQQSSTTADNVDEILTWLLELPLVCDGAAVKPSSSFQLDQSVFSFFFFFPALHQLQELQLLLWICDKEMAHFVLFELIGLNAAQ